MERINIKNPDARTNRFMEYAESDSHRPVSAYRRCAISVMDNVADPDITFDEKGISNYFYEYQRAVGQLVRPGKRGEEELRQKLEAIKRDGRGKRYDCIIGLSGGIDSTYLCLLAKRAGLRPLLVHCDNSWNSERAIRNMERTVRTLGFDLHTHLINWREFRELELAYLRASVVDIDIITDHAYVAVLYRLARNWKIKHVLAGINMATEQVLPQSWRHNADDAVNIRHILKAHGGGRLRGLKTFPVQNYFDKAFCHHVLKIRFTYPFNYGDYSITEAKKEVMREIGWEPFEDKHFDSIWTRFYQGYILPQKFGIDKRKAHLSNLIFSGQLSREEAMERLSKPAYPPELLSKDKALFLRKMGLSEQELEGILRQPRQEHTAFQTQKSFAERFPLAAPLLRWLRHNSRGKAVTICTGMALSHSEVIDTLVSS